MIKSSGVRDVTGVKKVFLGQLVGWLLILNVTDGVGDTGQKSMDFRQMFSFRFGSKYFRSVI